MRGMMVRTARGAFTRAALIVSVAAACAGAPSVACSANKGALMLAVTTDMRAPKDVNVVSVAIQVGPQVKYNFIGRVTPEGEVLLPATLAIVEPDDPNAVIKIRVIAFKDTKPRVLRDITTTTPRNGRVALLRLPLSFINDKSATGALKEVNLPKPLIASLHPGHPGGGTTAASIFPSDINLSVDEFNPFGADVVSVCTDIDQTMIDGECASSRVDEATLPDFDASLVTRADNKCFECKECFGSWREVGVDVATCTIEAGADITNIGLLSTEAGDCNADGECFVPIDKSSSASTDGWRTEGPLIQLPKGACKKVREGAKVAVVGGTKCETKTAAFPVCLGPGGAHVVVDGGTDADAAADADAATLVPAELEVAADFPSAVGSVTDRTYFGSPKGVFVHRDKETAPAQALPGSPTVTGSWFVSQLGGDIAFAHRTPITPSIDTTRGFLVDIAGGNLIQYMVPANANARVNGVMLTTMPDHIYFPVSETIGPSDVYYTGRPVGGTAGAAGLSAVGNATSIAYIPSINKFFVGNATGEVALYEANANLFVDSVPVDQAVVKSVEGLSNVEAGPSARAFALREDGIFFIEKVDSGATMTSTALTPGKNLAGFTDADYHPRGIASVPKCAFYASATGVEFVSPSGATKGVLATDLKGPVLGVSVRSLDQSVYFAVYTGLANGGGIYKTKIPASCL